MRRSSSSGTRRGRGSALEARRNGRAVRRVASRAQPRGVVSPRAAAPAPAATKSPHDAADAQRPSRKCSSAEPPCALSAHRCAKGSVPEPPLRAVNRSRALTRSDVSRCDGRPKSAPEIPKRSDCATRAASSVPEPQRYGARSVPRRRRSRVALWGMGPQEPQNGVASRTLTRLRNLPTGVHIRWAAGGPRQENLRTS